MDYGYPDPDEEYDLLHEDEYEVLREIEAAQEKKNKIGQTQQSENFFNKDKPHVETVLNVFSQKKNLTPLQNQAPTQKTNVNVVTNLDAPVAHCSKTQPQSQPLTQKTNVSIVTDLDAPAAQCSKYVSPPADGTRKRNYDELFGDISDILDLGNIDEIHEPSDKRPRWDQPQEIIKLVLDAREKYQESGTGIPKRKQLEEHKRQTISLRVPPWNFVAVTRPSNSQRIYVRVKSEGHKVEINERSVSNLLLVPYNLLKAEAEEILAKNIARSSCEVTQEFNESNIEDTELWVEKYRPRSYVELLSDETVNRHFLHWLKLWDKVVFNRNPVKNKKKKQPPKFWKQQWTNDEPEEMVDSKGFPIQKVALLSGPPGLGKTTLAHLAAKHAGYNVVEINASDERNPDAFRQALLASTQMRAVMGNDPRPNCLVLDEIDGAPAASIEVLIKFVQGKLTARGRKDKTKGRDTICHRPVICICNELYTPSLRALRPIALIVPVPEVSPLRLADRLMEISRKEHLKVTADALLKLAEISACDVRSCLGALQYMGSAKISDNLSFAMKDSRKGLFDSWKQILTIPMNRSGLVSIPDRVRAILKTVQNGESEKLAQGIFHNYPEVCSDKFQQISDALEWFEFFDEIISLVSSQQVWSVMSYTNYAFIAWHLCFARTRNFKLSYPSTMFEVIQKTKNSIGILSTIQRSSGRDILTLAVDIAPFLPDILSPRLRTVSGHLHSSKEKEDISRLVDILLEFGLTYVQEKTLEATYEYKLDPNIFEVGIFPECKARRALAYAVKQIIAQELEVERLRRAANITGIRSSSESKENQTNPTTEETAKDSTKNTQVPNGTSEAMKTPDTQKRTGAQIKEIIYKDFFGRPIIAKEKNDRSPKDQRHSGKSDKSSMNLRDHLTKHGVWYKYKEGFSNAVRRNVLMAELI